METLRGTIGRVPSFRAVDMPTDSSSSFNVDKEKLMQFAKSKNQEMFRELGGVDGIILSLKTHARYGIRGDAADLRNRIDVFESNSYRIRGVLYQYLLAILRSFKDFSFLLVSACCVYLLVVGIRLYGWNDGWQDGIYSIVFSLIFSMISSTIERGVGAYFDKAIKGSQLIIVLRNGLKHQIPVSSILVGDIALLKKGDKIPADGLLLEASGYQSLKLEESKGGKIVEISYSDPFLRSGAKVVEGQAKMLVTSTAVGTNTNEIYEITELRAQNNYLIRLLEIMKWILAMSTVLISVSRYFSGKAKDDQGYRLFTRGTTSTLEVSYSTVEYITAGSVIFVAMDTTNFSWALKVCFSHAINMMAARNVIVRNLRSWEKIGLGVATINVTYELNALNRLITSNFLFVPQITENKEVSSHISPDVLRLLHQGIGLNTTGISNHAQRMCGIKFLGSPSERAFLSQAALGSNVDWEKLINDCAIVKVENLENQGRVILVKKDDSFLEHKRGPAEMILAMCSGYYDDVGIQHPLNEDTRSLLEQKLPSMNSDNRTQVIALAYRQVPNRELKDDSNLDKNEDCYNLLGFVVLKEANKGEIVQDVVQKCRNAGMDLNIFHERNLYSGVARSAVTELGETGTNQARDNELLALGMTTRETDATECRCGQSKETKEVCTELATTQKNFGSMEQYGPFQVSEQNRQKENLDNGTDATELGETEMNQVSDDSIILEETRDNTNLVTMEDEVTALSEATVSISTGPQGDKTTKTSDIVILDGNAATLTLILKWAKCMLLNFQAFTQFQLTVMITSIVNAFISLALPVKTSGVNKALAYQLVQQIWVNTIMGLIAVVTFGWQRPQPSITRLQKPPEGEEIWLITGYMLRNIMTQSTYQITAVSVLQFKGTVFGFPDSIADTTTFVLPIFHQALNMISARKIEEKNIFSGIRLWVIWLIAALMVAPFVLVDILARIGYFDRLDAKQWAICITIALVSWPVGFAAKFVPVGFFAMLVRLVAAPIMAVANKPEELGNWIKSMVLNTSLYSFICKYKLTKLRKN